ncbi:hypothetical protein GOP47_0002074 [Adiantum capillus-veneris]|uniref:Uncharacterized protein n=1 Tax=Adiantum capillus-veneris TaxID=13818 RepID=A0A9D4ZQN6_ADICA|nr:hypothetical protein GOP47_0002074 [Adiantum capillus-veneris]
MSKDFKVSLEGAKGAGIATNVGRSSPGTMTQTLGSNTGGVRIDDEFSVVEGKPGPSRGRDSIVSDSIRLLAAIHSQP